MRLNAKLILAALATCLLMGCARNYSILTNNGRVITAKGKPTYDGANSVFVFKDANGVERRIPAGAVRQIAPASESSDPSSFSFPGAK